MSPYQQDVIDASLQEFDIQAQKGLGSIAQSAFNAGAFGGGREGVAKSRISSQHQIETEQHYKHNYYNKVLVKPTSSGSSFGQQQALAQQQQA